MFVGLENFGTGGEQRLRQSGTMPNDRIVQRRQRQVCLGVRVGRAGQQQRDNRGVIELHCDMQRRLAGARARIYVGAPLESIGAKGDLGLAKRLPSFFPMPDKAGAAA